MTHTPFHTPLSKLGEQVSTVPTTKFNAERIQHCNNDFEIWDLGGHERIRWLWLWDSHILKAQAIIFVVDSTDTNRFDEASEALHGFLDSCTERGLLADAKVLVFANKQDLPGALSELDLVDRLNLRSMRHEWYIQACCGTKGTGLCEGMESLGATMKGKSKLHCSFSPPRANCSFLQPTCLGYNLK